MLHQPLAAKALAHPALKLSVCHRKPRLFSHGEEVYQPSRHRLATAFHLCLRQIELSAISSRKVRLPQSCGSEEVSLARPLASPRCFVCSDPRAQKSVPCPYGAQKVGPPHLSLRSRETKPRSSPGSSALPAPAVPFE